MVHFRKRKKTDGKKALAEIRKLKRMINLEIFHHYIDSGLQFANTNGSIEHMSGIPSGDGSQDRTGEKVQVIRWRVTVRTLLTTGAQEDFIRIILVRDRQMNGVKFLLSDLLQNVNADAVVTSPFNWDNSKRFIIIADTMFSLDTSKGTSRVSRFNRKLSFPLKFLGGTGAIGDATTNAMFIVVVANKIPSALDTMFQVNSEVLYTDV